MNVGQEVTMPYKDFLDPSIERTFESYIVTKISDTSFTTATGPTNYVRW